MAVNGDKKDIEAKNRAEIQKIFSVIIAHLIDSERKFLDDFLLIRHLDIVLYHSRRIHFGMQKIMNIKNNGRKRKSLGATHKIHKLFHLISAKKNFLQLLHIFSAQNVL